MSNNSPSLAARRLCWAVVPALMALAGAAQAQNYDRYYDDGYNGGPVRCESIKNRTQQCALPGRARLVRQISGSPCVEGQTWGQARGGVWVTQGCRAEFVAEGGRGGGRWNGGGNGWGHNGGGNSGRGQILTCDSNDHRRQRCVANVRREARLIRQTSRNACIEGRTWGWDRTGVWVDGGCRAQFQIY
ncbi:DUF3011 domain-containing protein [Stenotrophomonas maltophilia]|uniref:DUF3011 domain-containing protein n=1 Tax=Stenotrophomonas maltophilia TaxID=40324 RepID=UPI003BA3456D